MEKITLNQAVIVEGKYDKIKLSNFLDAHIIQTNGFAIFKDNDTKRLIQRLAMEKGIIIMTDSDHAGFMIRNYISKGIPNDRIINVYIPDVLGKESRKKAPSKEGKLGVEGMTRQIILDALSRAGVTSQPYDNIDPVSNYDLYELGLSGTPDAKEKRKNLLRALDLPENMSTSSMISCINRFMTKTELMQILKAE